MVPLIVFVVVTVGVFVAGAVGVRRLRPWPVALRGGLAALFTTTGVAHFVGMRAELIAMVPPELPAPGLLITISGVLELAGAAGLLLRPTAPWAAGGLAAMLVALYPANVYAAVEGIATAPEDGLLPRTLIQLLWLGAALAVVVSAVRARRAERRATELVGAGARG
jgi:uncharacterized membrane protein